MDKVLVAWVAVVWVCTLMAAFSAGRARYHAARAEDARKRALEWEKIREAWVRVRNANERAEERRRLFAWL